LAESVTVPMEEIYDDTEDENEEDEQEEAA
jgi:hypothetical protein